MSQKRITKDVNCGKSNNEDRKPEHAHEEIVREDDLVNTRITWNLTFQGLLFAALAIIGSKDSDQGDVAKILKYILPFVGFSSSMLCCFAVMAAIDQINRHRKKLSEEKKSTRFAHFFGNLYPSLLPFLIACTWMIVAAEFDLPLMHWLNALLRVWLSADNEPG